MLRLTIERLDRAAAASAEVIPSAADPLRNLVSKTEPTSTRHVLSLAKYYLLILMPLRVRANPFVAFALYKCDREPHLMFGCTNTLLKLHLISKLGQFAFLLLFIVSTLLYSPRNFDHLIFCVCIGLNGAVLRNVDKYLL